MSFDSPRPSPLTRSMLHEPSQEFENVPDGRIFVTNKGREKFKVLKVVKEKPVMLCEVEMMPEEGKSDSAEVRGGWKGWVCEGWSGVEMMPEEGKNDSAEVRGWGGWRG